MTHKQFYFTLLQQSLRSSLNATVGDLNINLGNLSRLEESIANDAIREIARRGMEVLVTSD